MTFQPSPDDLILSVDTATTTQSVAILRGKDILCEFYAKQLRQEDQSLLSLVDFALHYVSLTIHDMQRFVISRGPGAFTRLRVSMALLKSFSLSLDRPLYAASTLDAIAMRFTQCDKLFCACIDARRAEVYAAFYRMKDDKMQKITDELLLSPVQLAEYSNQNFPGEDILYAGSATPLYEKVLRENGEGHAFFTDVPAAPSASAMALQVLEQHPDTLPDIPIESLEPKYIRVDTFELPKPFDFSKPERPHHHDAG